MYKRLRDTENSQSEILRLIENLSSKVDSLSIVWPEPGSSNSRIGTQEDSTNSLSSENDILNGTSNAGHNKIKKGIAKLKGSKLTTYQFDGKQMFSGWIAIDRHLKTITLVTLKSIQFFLTPPKLSEKKQARNGRSRKTSLHFVESWKK